MTKISPRLPLITLVLVSAAVRAQSPVARSSAGQSSASQSSASRPSVSAMAPKNLLPPDLISEAAPPPPITAALPPPVPVMLPKLTDDQAHYLVHWLASDNGQGLALGKRPDTSQLSGDALVRATLDRARALHSGRIDTTDFLEIWALRPARYDPLPGLVQALSTDRLPQWTASLTPRYAGYEALRTGLVAYQTIRDHGGWRPLGTTASAASIRNRISIEDVTVTPDVSQSEAIQRAQRRYGLNPTGLLDARTLAELNVPIGDRIDAIVANMERWRWLPRDLPVNRVQVNIAAAVLTVFEGDTPVTSMRAVTGSPDNATPMLASSIHSIVVNPPWNVPTSIAKRELWPKGRTTILAEGYKIVGTPETGERIVQPPGPKSALGRLKFDFDNPFAVYLHDTPSRAKFSSFDRLASHGCVRLEKPVPLAELMLKNDPVWAGQVQTAIDTGKTQRVQLPKQVAVYLLYWTAFASANGIMNFRADPYGWDKLLATKIDAAEKRAAATTIAMGN